MSIDLFSQMLNERENEVAEEIVEENLPKQHFAEADVQIFWNEYLSRFRKDLIFNAICDFKFSKLNEDSILIQYTSESAKMEFDKISAQFFSELKHKLNNFSIQIEYKEMGIANSRKEKITKRSMFEKMVEKNPLLLELNTIFKFDLND